MLASIGNKLAKVDWASFPVVTIFIRMALWSAMKASLSLDRSALIILVAVLCCLSNGSILLWIRSVAVDKAPSLPSARASLAFSELI